MNRNHKDQLAPRPPQIAENQTDAIGDMTALADHTMMEALVKEKQ